MPDNNRSMRWSNSTVLLILFLSACGGRDAYNLPELEGKSEEYILKKYGAPEYVHPFLLTDTVLEYRYGLLSRFPNERNIPIREKKFNAGNLTIFVWFYKKNDEWVVASSLFVPEGVKI